MNGVNEAAPMHLMDLLAEASRALATLDAGRLEELATSCQALNSDLPTIPMSIRSMPAAEVRATCNKLATLGRVLEVTRGNLQVMRQITAFESGLRDYASPTNVWLEGVARDGDN